MKPRLISAFSTFGILDIVSREIERRLSTAGYPALSILPNGKRGRIIVGEPSQFDKLLAPRIIFRPLKAGFDAPDMGLGPVTIASDPNDPERRTSRQDPAIFTEAMMFEVWCSSLAPDGAFDAEADYDYDRVDYDYTRALYHVIIGAFQNKMPNAFDISSGGTWSPKEGVTRIVREFVFRMSIGIPIRKDITPTLAAPGVVAGYPYAPANTQPHITDQLHGPEGTSSPGCEDE